MNLRYYLGGVSVRQMNHNSFIEIKLDYSIFYGPATVQDMVK
jgi:hypothetical protein